MGSREVMMGIECSHLAHAGIRCVGNCETEKENSSF